MPARGLPGCGGPASPRRGRRANSHGRKPVVHGGQQKAEPPQGATQGAPPTRMPVPPADAADVKLHNPLAGKALGKIGFVSQRTPRHFVRPVAPPSRRHRMRPLRAANRGRRDAGATPRTLPNCPDLSERGRRDAGATRAAGPGARHRRASPPQAGKPPAGGDTRGPSDPHACAAR